MTLVLKRRSGQSIVIGDEKIVVTVVEIVRGQVRIAVQAPHWVQVYRSELLEEKPS